MNEAARRPRASAEDPLRRLAVAAAVEEQGVVAGELGRGASEVF